MNLVNTPPKGTADWFPDEFKVRKYIFDTWRKVCIRYGFEEYLWPLVESVDIWKAKSGDDVGGSELTQITNREGNLDGLAIRPEMTPTVTRMVSRIWKETDKPIKWFSIANFYRNEKPQKWRNREFWQLNADIFWETALTADIEVISLSLDLMEAFNPPKWSYILRLNHREIINMFFEHELGIQDMEQSKQIMRLLDKYEKLPRDVFQSQLQEQWVRDIQKILRFMESTSIADLRIHFPALAWTQVFAEFEEVYMSLEKAFGNEVIQYSSSLIRGFDYYDGMIFEVFDMNPENPRALFWGGRYNGLASIFGVKEEVPAIGFAPGDETMKLFLEWHGLLENILNIQEEKTYIPLLSACSFSQVQALAKELRSIWKNVLVWLSPKKIDKALKYADKKWIRYVVILWGAELEKGVYILKDMQSGTQEEKALKK